MLGTRISPLMAAPAGHTHANLRARPAGRARGFPGSSAWLQTLWVWPPPVQGSRLWWVSLPFVWPSCRSFVLMYISTVKVLRPTSFYPKQYFSYHHSLTVRTRQSTPPTTLLQDLCWREFHPNAKNNHPPPPCSTRRQRRKPRDIAPSLLAGWKQVSRGGVDADHWSKPIVTFSLSS